MVIKFKISVAAEKEYRGEITIPAISPEKLDKLLDKAIASLIAIRDAAAAQECLANEQVKSAAQAMATLAQITTLNKELLKP
jgi:hypothetical protein